MREEAQSVMSARWVDRNFGWP